MKLTVAELLVLAEGGMLSASPRGFGENAALRKMVQVKRLVNDTGMGKIEVVMPVPQMSKEGRRALKKAPQRRGGSRKSRAVTKQQEE